MSKFNVGDKVRRVEDINTEYIASSGQIVTVKEIYNGGHFSVEEDNQERVWYADYFELVEDNKIPQNQPESHQHSQDHRQPHKHAELIKAWADGAEIEYKHEYSGTWRTIEIPLWSDERQYRLKPTPKPDMTRTMFVELNPSLDNAYDDHNVEFVFDGETHKLKAVRIL